MVTKHQFKEFMKKISSVLAKIHMVTKLSGALMGAMLCSVLAKIHMVTKQMIA